MASTEDRETCRLRLEIERTRTDRWVACAVAAAFVGVAASIAGGVAYCVSTTQRAAIEAGLVQGTVPGVADAVWVRPDDGTAGSREEAP
jgi:fatty acid desaturase